MKKTHRPINTLNWWPLIIRYKGVEIDHPYDNLPARISFIKTDRLEADQIIDFLSYISYSPLFIGTLNVKIDKPLIDLYENNIYEQVDTTPPLITTDFGLSELLIVEKLNYPILLALYNTALKQPEPLAKCVFLFRIIEFCYYNIDYQNSNKPTMQNFINELIKSALKYKLVPLYLYRNPYYSSKIKNPRYIAPPWNAIKRNNISANQISKWKKAAKKNIFNKTNVGKEVYNVGRCGIAHAKGSGHPVILHDYADDYKKIKKINIFLELITRYLIERENPSIKNYIGFK